MPILLVDDESDNLDAFRFTFRKSFEIHTATSGQEALEILKAHDIAVLISDQRMPKMTGLELIQAAKTVRPDAVPIILTAYSDVDVLIESINLGRVYRYITKPWDSKEVRGILTQAIERFSLRRENEKLQAQLKQLAGAWQTEAHESFGYGEIVGSAPALGEVLKKLEQVAPTQSTVLLRGETGTGKEVTARAIHINSPRESGPFVRVHCAALAQGVLESELFGHEKGAFTGAVARRAGRFELADGGTLFLDEVGDLPMEVQIKLLRVIQEKEFERVGGTETLRTNVRVISATHRDLEDMVTKGTFRQDLYYRLNVFPIVLPPLRERKEDIPLLAQHFIAKCSANLGKRVTGCNDGALAALTGYHWPGNIRELENVIERAIIVARGEILDAADLQLMASRPVTATGNAASTVSPAGSAGSFGSTSPAGRATLGEHLDAEERTALATAIEREHGNIAAAARSLGINRSTLYYRLKRAGLSHLLPERLQPGT